MARITWDSMSNRYYETGLDRGVLFVENAPGVPWSGLVSINEEPNGGSPRPYYIDGYKYLNISSSEEYEATLSSYGHPQEFSECNGLSEIHNGLFSSGQPRSPFSMSYRTLIGNDTEGRKKGYKIHLVYNALASPSAMKYETVSSDSTSSFYEWRITTKAIPVQGKRHTSHFVIDTRYTPKDLLANVENVIYGSQETQPRIPSVPELVTMFKDWGNNG